VVDGMCIIGLLARPYLSLLTLLHGLSLEAIQNMVKLLVSTYSALLFLCCYLSAALSQTTGALPGCRFVVRPTDKWLLPTQYRTPSNVANWKNGVCSTVKTTTPYVFGVDEGLYIQSEGLSRIYCPGDSVTTYCVTSNYLIMKCGDLGCAQTTGGSNACSIPVSKTDCVFRNNQVAIKSALANLEIYWDEIMSGVEFWLKKWAFAVGVDTLKVVWGKKSTIINAIKAKVGTITTMTPTSFKKIVVDAIGAAVPAAGKLFFTIGKGISFIGLVWDIMNWDIFVVQAY
jgi:hypothetical protein